ncbi:hypothetical protein ABBQ32_010212 [Trebouxia sp. C0010 RCD-2024]
MVLGTVSATDVTSQPLRSQPSADDVGVTISSKRNGPKAAARVLMVVQQPACKLALKTIVSMIRHDWVKCTDDVRQLSGVCSSWLRGRDPSMTLQAFRDLWCHHDALASIHTAHTGTEDKLELVVNLSDMVPVQLF